MQRWHSHTSTHHLFFYWLSSKLKKASVFFALAFLALCAPITQAQDSANNDTRYHRAAKFGNMLVQNKNQVLIDEKAFTFAPAVRIFSDRQRLIRPSSLLGEKMAVAYIVDRHNDINQVWVLTPEEVQLISKKK